MYLLYLDDSGSAPNPAEEHFVLAGVLLRESKLYWINKHLDDLAKTIDPINPSEVEFHASAIFSGRKSPWNALHDKSKRASIIKRVLGVVQREVQRDGVSHCAVFACVVEKKVFPNHDPVELAFENLCNRFDLYLKRIYHHKREPHQGVIILDESSHETSLQRLAKEFRQIGTRWGVTENLNEVPLFVDSKASRAIQLADHIAYAVFRRYEHKDLNYFDVIQGCFDSEEGRIHGLVHKCYNDECTCPACISRRLSGS